jgi:hypothetical protein
MEHIVDTNVNVTKALNCLKQSGIRTIIRYYNRDQTPKVIKQAEANAILAAGLSLCIVHQRNGQKPSEYGKRNGTLDAAHCRQYGQSLGQPAGSGIYFGVDFDILKPDLIAQVVPYFEAVRTEMARASDLPAYRIGVYGSGLTCSTLLDRGLVDFTWLAQARKFQGTAAFRASNRWNILQLMTDRLCGIGIDPDIANPAKPDFGQFGAGAKLAPASATHPKMRATARHGLRLRSGPGAGFEQIGSLPFGKEVFEVRREGEWSFVDLEGDGRVDGAANNGFLEPA